MRDRLVDRGARDVRFPAKTDERIARLRAGDRVVQRSRSHVGRARRVRTNHVLSLDHERAAVRSHVACGASELNIRCIVRPTFGARDVVMELEAER